MTKIPKLRFKEFTGEWEEKSLGKLCDIYDGTHETPKYTKIGVKFVSVENISNIYKTDKYISKEDYDKNFKIKPKLNDIFMTRIGVIGQTAIVDRDEDLAYYVSLALIRVHNNKIDSRFLKKYILTKYLKIELNKRIIHVAFPKKINLKDIGRCNIKICEVKEQEKIANFLSVVNEKIVLEEDKLNTLKLYKKGLMQKIFNREIRFKDENGHDYPEWEEKRLGDVIFELEKNKEINPKNCRLLSVKLHCLGIDYTDNYPNATQKGRPYYKRFKGELLIGRQNMHNGGIGIVSDNCDGLIASNAISSYLNRDGVDLKFIYYTISRPSYYRKIDFLIGGTGQKEISNKQLVNLPFSKACLEEQNKIINLMISVDFKIKLQEQKLRNLKLYKRGLLSQMFV